MYNEENVSKKSWWVAFILLLIGPGLCWHRIYVGKVGTGILWLFTGGGFFVGVWIDLYKLCTGQFTDKDGLPVVRK